MSGQNPRLRIVGHFAMADNDGRTQQSADQLLPQGKQHQVVISRS
jgi:hypothetical protein